MKSILRLALLSSLALGTAAHAAEDGFKPLFNGQDLSGWTGNPKLWSVKDGVIHGQTTPEYKLKHNTFLVYTNGEFANFELRFSYKIVPNNDKGFGNSGVQYRSKVMQQGEQGPIVGGYQADFEAAKTYSGINYEERGRGILAQRGQITIIKADPADPKKTKVEVVGSVGKTEELQANIKAEDWNDYTVIARDYQLTHIINGRVTSIVSDEQPDKGAKSGILALQIHVGEPMTVEFRNIRVREIGGSATTASANPLDLMQGKWVGSEIIANGRTSDDPSGIKLSIKGERFEAVTPDNDINGSLKFVGKNMDVLLDDGDVKTFYAIYEVSGDTMKVCYSPISRPTDFSAPEDSKRILAVYKRAK